MLLFLIEETGGAAFRYLLRVSALECTAVWHPEDSLEPVLFCLFIFKTFCNTWGRAADSPSDQCDDSIIYKNK
jgi:hypothetical protein